jgi:hypothetical protein
LSNLKTINQIIQRAGKLRGERSGWRAPRTHCRAQWANQNWLSSMRVVKRYRTARPMRYRKLYDSV